MMRTAQHLPRFRAAIRHKRVTHGVQLQPAARSRASQRAVIVFACAAAFLFGYLPGILLGREGQTLLGQQLAGYYMDTGHFSVWSSIFWDRLAGGFLQWVTLLLCAFSAFGTGVLILLFLAKGMFLGFCASNLAALGGSGALLFYWSASCLPNLLLTFLGLWLAGYASQVSRGLFQNAFLGGAPRGQMAASVRRLAIRSGASLVVLCLVSLFGSGMSVFAARVFL